MRVATERGLIRLLPGVPGPAAGSDEARAREAVAALPLCSLPLPPSASIIARGLVACFGAAKRPPTADVMALASTAPAAPGMPVVVHSASTLRPSSGVSASPIPGAVTKPGAGAGAEAGASVGVAGDAACGRGLQTSKDSASDGNKEGGPQVGMESEEEEL